MNVNINQNTPLYAGSILTLTCTVTIDFYVDKSGSIIVAIEWSSLRNISGNRYSITPTLNSGNIYTSNLNISHLETQDSGIYTCSVTVSGGDYVHQADASNSISITVDQKNITGMRTHSHQSPYMTILFPFCVASNSVEPIATPVVIIASVFVILIATALIICILRYVFYSQNISVVEYIADTTGIREC